MTSRIWAGLRPSVRYARRREIEGLDVERDHSEIWLLDMAYEFPWDMQLGGGIGFYASLAPPRVARLLARTGEIARDTGRRLDDTNILMWEMFRNGFADPRGRAAVRQMNRIHRNAVRDVSGDGEQWSIENEDYLFVLSAIMVNMVRAVERHGWRRFCDTERRAAFLHFREMGRLMGIRDMPDSYQGFVRFHDAYLRTELAYTPEAAELWRSTRGMLVDVLTGWLPERLRTAAARPAEALLPVLLGPDLCRAFGLAPPSPRSTAAVRAALRLRAFYVRLTPPRRESAMPDTMPTERFPEGDYTFDEVGPEHSIRPSSERRPRSNSAV